MKKLFTILFLTFLLGSVSYAQLKIGLPAGAAQSSSILDLSNTDDGTKALSLPRVANTAMIILPVNGMLVYDISSNSIKAYENGVWLSYSSQAAATPAVGVNCVASAVNALYTQNNVLTAANTVTVVVVNNSFSAVTITPSTTDVVLSGTGAAGMTVASFSPATVSPGSGGGTSIITYTLSGTPTTVGTFTATWTKLSLTCAKTGTVCLDIAPITVSNTTTPATLPLTTVAGNTVDFTAAGGVPNTALTWVMSSYPATGIFSNATTGTGAAAQAILVAGASGNITVTYTATNACGLIKTGTQTANVNPLFVNCATSAINGIYTQNIALTAANNITMKLVNNGNAATTVTPSTADIVFSGTAGISLTTVSPASISIPANGGTATITYSLGGTPTSIGAFTANWTNGVLACVKSGLVCATMTPVTVSSTTTPATLPATIVAGNSINFTAAGGTPNTGYTWTMTSSPATGVFSNTASGTGTTAQAILVANTSGLVTIVFTSTNACGFTVTGTQTATTGDAVRSALVAGGCTSCSVYDAAAANTWVQVTAAEYAQIDNFVTVSLGAANETIMSITPNATQGAGYTWSGYGSNYSPIPAYAYIVAFSGWGFTNSTGPTNVGLRYSTTSTSTGFSNYSTPNLILNGNGTYKRLYNVMKKPANLNNSAGAAVALYGGASAWAAQTTLAGQAQYYQTGDVSDVSGNNNNSVPMYQVKATTIKKW